MSGEARGVSRVDRVLDAVAAHLRECDPGGVLGLYLYGSEVSGNCGPESDIDLLLVTGHSLSLSERVALTRLLLGISGWSGHGELYPEVAGRRPVELTVLAIGTARPWEPVAAYDYQFGEWLRSELSAGAVPEPTEDPDAILLIATALAGYRRVIGEELSDLLAPVGDRVLRAAAAAVVPGLVSGIRGDERNALLTLARAVVTVETGRIVPKPVAALAVAVRLTPGSRAVLGLASEEYRGGQPVAWRTRAAAVTAAAEELAALALASAPSTARHPKSGRS